MRQIFVDIKCINSHLGRTIVLTGKNWTPKLICNALVSLKINELCFKGLRFVCNGKIYLPFDTRPIIGTNIFTYYS